VLLDLSHSPRCLVLGENLWGTFVVQEQKAKGVMKITF
jgi:hypothetical protein